MQYYQREERRGQISLIIKSPKYNSLVPLFSIYYIYAHIAIAMQIIYMFIYVNTSICTVFNSLYYAVLLYT